jgi:pimeloyl-ACP methyl ester carboxylesterase
MRERVRVIGVDFDTYLSQWGNTCPKESFKTSLSDRSDDILQKLKNSGIGQRPVIFVGHSMGGK